MTDTRDEVERLDVRLRRHAPCATGSAHDVMIEAADTIEALRQRAEAAERRAEDESQAAAYLRSSIHCGNKQRDMYKYEAEDLQAALTEARAQVAAAWEAGRDAACEDAGNYMTDDADEALLRMWREDIRALTPPADASAALTARLDAERRACATECEMCPDENWGQWMAARIMARCEGE